MAASRTLPPELACLPLVSVHGSFLHHFMPNPASRSRPDPGWDLQWTQLGPPVDPSGCLEGGVALSNFARNKGHDVWAGPSGEEAWSSLRMTLDTWVEEQEGRALPRTVTWTVNMQP